MTYVRCNSGRFPPWMCNCITEECTKWLNENVGQRWKHWDWHSVEFGVVMLPDSDAVAFKIKFGI